MSSHQVQMRWRDLDGLGHVNHMVVLTYLEEGRDAFLAGHGINRDEYVVGRCSVGFNREIAAARVGHGRVPGGRGGQQERDHERAHRRRRRQYGDRGPVHDRALGPGDAARRARSPTRSGLRSAERRRWPPDGAGTSIRSCVTCAITGADVFRENNPNIPYTTQEIAESTIEAAAAGATVAHLHVREDDGTPSGRPELFVDAIDRIRAGCDVLTMVSTGGANDMTIEERTTGLEAKPDISGVESGSMNFGDETFITPPPAGRGIVERAQSAGIALEVECFDVGHVVSALRWIEQGVLEGPLRINLVFGVPGGIDASPEALDAMLRPLPGDTFWTVTCIGRHHRRMLALALLKGAPGIRTGLEDVAYIAKGELAPSNAALVEMAVGMARALGRDVADQAQTKELLRLG